AQIRRIFLDGYGVLDVRTDEKSLSSEDEGVTRVKAFMDIAEDEPAVGKTDVRSGQ
ncbi:hypothetical protein Tco_0775939, partial [Tanacetum coccineum]